MCSYAWLLTCVWGAHMCAHESRDGNWRWCCLPCPLRQGLTWTQSLLIPVCISEGLRLQAVAIPTPHSCESYRYKLIFMLAPLPVLPWEASSQGVGCTFFKDVKLFFEIITNKMEIINILYLLRNTIYKWRHFASCYEPKEHYEEILHVKTEKCSCHWVIHINPNRCWY